LARIFPEKSEFQKMAGRPRFKPKPAQRNLVELLKAEGWSNERIAAQIGVSPDTLAVAFAAEIEAGADEKRAELLEAMWRVAKKGNAAAGKWLARRFDAARAAMEGEVGNENR
jgi:hypothetical protein